MFVGVCVCVCVGCVCFSYSRCNSLCDVLVFVGV